MNIGTELSTLSTGHSIQIIAPPPPAIHLVSALQQIMPNHRYDGPCVLDWMQMGVHMGPLWAPRSCDPCQRLRAPTAYAAPTGHVFTSVGAHSGLMDLPDLNPVNHTWAQVTDSCSLLTLTIFDQFKDAFMSKVIELSVICDGFSNNVYGLVVIVRQQSLRLRGHRRE